MNIFVSFGLFPNIPKEFRSIKCFRHIFFTLQWPFMRIPAQHNISFVLKTKAVWEYLETNGRP